MNKTVEYILGGKFDNGTVKAYGKGFFNSKTGESELNVTFDKLPKNWDPRTITLICCYRMMGFNSLEIDGAKSLENLSQGKINIGTDLPDVTRKGFMYDEKGELLTNISAYADFDLQKNNNHDISTIKEGFSKLQPGVNGIDKIITPFSGSMMQVGPNLVVVNTSYEVILENGQRAFGTTMYPNYMPNQKEKLPFNQILTITDLETTLKDNKLEVYTKSTVEPMQKIYSPVKETLLKEYAH